MRSDLLFSSGKLYEFLENRVAKMKEAIERYDGNKLLNSSVDDLTSYFVSLGRVEPLVLLEHQIAADQHETKLEVPNQFAAFGDGPKTLTVDGVGFSYHIPFTGDPALFRLQPSTYTYNPPTGVIRGSELVLTHFARSGTTRQPETASRSRASERQAVRGVVARVD